MLSSVMVAYQSSRGLSCLHLQGEDWSRGLLGCDTV